MPNHLPQRKSPRLQGYDYSQEGAYFVTICTHNRRHLFGQVVDGDMVLSESGIIAHTEITRIPSYWNGQVDVDACVVMPNHVHVIILLVGTPFSASAHMKPDTITDAKNRVPTTPPTLGTVMGSYKSGATRRIRAAVGDPDLHVWQERYHDHIIRSEVTLNHIRQYVLTNPACWASDSLNA